MLKVTKTRGPIHCEGAFPRTLGIFDIVVFTLNKAFSFPATKVLEWRAKMNKLKDVPDLPRVFLPTLHCWASRHSQGFEDKNLKSSPGLFGQ